MSATQSLNNWKKTVYLSPYNHVKKPQTQDIIFTNLRLNVHVILLFVRQWQRWPLSYLRGRENWPGRWVRWWLVRPILLGAGDGGNCRFGLQPASHPVAVERWGWILLGIRTSPCFAKDPLCWQCQQHWSDRRKWSTGRSSVLDLTCNEHHVDCTAILPKAALTLGQEAILEVLNETVKKNPR